MKILNLGVGRKENEEKLQKYSYTWWGGGQKNSIEPRAPKPLSLALLTILKKVKPIAPLN